MTWRTTARATTQKATHGAEQAHRVPPALASALITAAAPGLAAGDDDADEVERGEVDERLDRPPAASSRGLVYTDVDLADRDAGDVRRAALAAPGDDDVARGRRPRCRRRGRGRGGRCRRCRRGRAGSRPPCWSRAGRRPPSRRRRSSSTVAVVRVARTTRPTSPSLLSTVMSGVDAGGGAGVDGHGAENDCRARARPPGPGPGRSRCSARGRVRPVELGEPVAVEVGGLDLAAAAWSSRPRAGRRRCAGRRWSGSSRARPVNGRTIAAVVAFDRAERPRRRHGARARPASRCRRGSPG